MGDEAVVQRRDCLQPLKEFDIVNLDVERVMRFFKFEADLKAFAGNVGDEMAVAIRMSLEYFDPLQP